MKSEHQIHTAGTQSFKTYLLPFDIYMPSTAKSVLPTRNLNKSHKEKNGEMKPNISSKIK